MKLGLKNHSKKGIIDFDKVRPEISGVNLLN
jgi:hypothetical protein